MREYSSNERMFSSAILNIPYHENDDAVRLLMGGNQAKQAIPLVNPEIPILKSGYEQMIYEYGLIKATHSGTIAHIDRNTNLVIIKKDKIKDHDSPIEMVWCLNNGIIYTNPGYPRKYDCEVEIDQKVKAGDVIFSPTNNVSDSHFANGVNLKTAIKLNPNNYEDAIHLSETAAKKLSSKHAYKLEVALSDDEVLRNLLDTDPEDYEILPKIGQAIEAGGVIIESGVYKNTIDTLFNGDWKNKSHFAPKNCKVANVDFYVNKYSSCYTKYTKWCDKYLEKRNQENKILTERLEKYDVPKDIIASLIYKPKWFSKKNKQFQKDQSIVRINLEYSTELMLGDKLANRHGNKGVIAKITPDNEMPRTPDGASIELELNPLGIISRMNLGQLYELHLSKLIRDHNILNIDNYFDNKLTFNDVVSLYKSNGLTMKEDLSVIRPNGKHVIIPQISTGYMFIQKLFHMSESKCTARSIGSYSTKSNRPIGGKSKIDNLVNSAQRLGEMEILCLLGHGAENTVKEFLTIKSSDTKSRQEFIKSIMQDKEHEFDLDNCSFSQDLETYLKAMGFEL